MCDKYWSGGALKGYDKEGGPVWILPIGNFDPKGQIFMNMLNMLNNICDPYMYTHAHLN